MTVNQSSSTYFQSTEPREAQMLDQLREITGVQDATLLSRALADSRANSGAYDVSRAVALLVKSRQTDDQPETASLAGAPDVAEPTERKVRFDPSDTELRRAIALSLQEQASAGSSVGATGISREEEDIARVLEASIADQNAGSKRRRGSPWIDSINPNERKRENGWPVGLKNVGNTCWFSAVVQSLFHLPLFRGLVLRYRPVKREHQTPEEERTAQFMLELRRLFALLVASEKRYVDPRRAVDWLKKVLDGGATDSQQDISEFTHKLLEWLEEAFKYAETDEEAGRGDRRSRNPVISLFYGWHKTEGFRDGLPYTQTETFGQFPLAVVPDCDLHQALEASVAPPAGPHQWFTVLPPVLLLELSRFHFDQALGRTEKIHDRLTFPAQIYMDRYLEVNKNIVTVKRAEIAKLRQKRRELRSRLDQYLSFGSTPPRLPLSRLLGFTLQYARGAAGEPAASELQDVDMESAAPAVTSMLVDSPGSSPQPARRAASHPNVPSPDTMRTRTSSNGRVSNGAGSVLSPSHTSREELAVVQRCLERWVQEVDKEVKELKRQIREIDVKIEAVFDEPSLQQVPYRLHSVLVHEGQAVSGHYWAYVLHPQRGVWMKFNDNTVTEATWEDLCLESVGGHHNTSAYCLVYIDVNQQELMEDRTLADKESGMVDPEDEAQQLPLPLQQYVDEDNRRFQEELASWNQDQAPGSEDQPMAEPAAGWEELSGRHAVISLPSTLELLKTTVREAPDAGAEQWIAEALRRTTLQMRERVVKMDADPSNDYRMTSMGVYMLRNGALLSPDLRWLLLEQFTHPNVSAVPMLLELYQAASLELSRLVDACSEEERRRYRCWHVHYNEFRGVAWSTVLGLERLAQERYTEALLYLLQACSRNEQLVSQEGGVHRGLDPAQLAMFRRRAVLGLNKQAVELFLSGQPEQAVQLTQDGTVPALVDLARSECDQDRAAADDIRNKWCNLLEQTLDDRSQQVLQTIITQLIEPAAEHDRPTVPIKVQGIEQQLTQRYREALSRLKQDG